MALSARGDKRQLAASPGLCRDTWREMRQRVASA